MGEESLTTVPFDRTVEQVSRFSLFLLENNNVFFLGFLSSSSFLVWLHFLNCLSCLLLHSMVVFYMGYQKGGCLCVILLLQIERLLILACLTFMSSVLHLFLCVNHCKSLSRHIVFINILPKCFFLVPTGKKKDF